MKHLIVAISFCAVTVAATVAPPVAIAGELPEYGKVIVKKDKKVDYAAFKTYTWTKTLPSVNKEIDAAITAAVDRELSTLGLTIAASGTGDVLVSYTSLNRTDVDLDAEGDDDLGLPYWVGTLVVSLLDPHDFHYILRLRIDQPISTDPKRLEASIDQAVTALFAKYPTRRRK